MSPYVGTAQPPPGNSVFPDSQASLDKQIFLDKQTSRDKTASTPFSGEQPSSGEQPISGYGADWAASNATSSNNDLFSSSSTTQMNVSLWWLILLLPAGILLARSLCRHFELFGAKSSAGIDQSNLPISLSGVMATQPVANDDAARFALCTVTSANSIACDLGQDNAWADMQDTKIQDREKPFAMDITSVDVLMANNAFTTHDGFTTSLEPEISSSSTTTDDSTWITLTPLNSHQGEVNWHLSARHRHWAKQQGGKTMMVRIHDADPATQPGRWMPGDYSYECSAHVDRRRVEFPMGDRDYIVELGFFTHEGQWLHVARSSHSHSPSSEQDGHRIVMMPCDSHRLRPHGPTRHPKPQAYVYWDIAAERKRRLRKAGGQMLVLRVYDADCIDIDQQRPHHTDEYVIEENARDKVVTVPGGDRDYVAEIGYLTVDGQFLSIGRSVHAHIPAMVHQQ